MSPEEGSPHMDRIEGLKDRVKKLEERGTDISKVTKILQNLESSIGSVEEEGKIDEALTKFDNLLLKMESKGKKTKRKRSVKKKVVEPEAPPEEVEEKAETPPEEEKKEEAPVEEEKEAPPPEEETPVEEGSDKKDEEQLPEEVIEERSPEEEAPPEEKEPEPPSPQMNVELADEELAKIDEMTTEIATLGGDSSPIQPHIDAMKQARSVGDDTNFNKYLGTAKDWLVQYLLTLRRSNIEKALNTLNERISDFTKVDEEARVKAISQVMEKLLIGYETADLEALGLILKDVQEVQGRMEESFKTLTEDLTKMVNESCTIIEGVIKEISEEFDTTILKDELQQVKEHLFNGEYVEARVKGQELLIKTIAERDSKEMKKLESLLLSIDPLFGKIEESEGKESEVYKALDEERESIIERSKRDVNDALKLMGGLLDKASETAADIEERSLQGLDDRIKATKGEAEALSETLNVDPILNILEKAENMVIEGQVDKASVLLEKAELAFIKLKEKRAVEVATFRVNELKDRMVVLGEKGIDVSPLEDPIENASKAVQAGDIKNFETIMQTIDQKLLFLRNEELKVDYQKALIRVVNDLREIKEGGQDVSDLEKEVDQFKNLYMERKYEEAVSTAEKLLKRVGGRKLYKVIDERKRIVEDTLKEAEGLLVDVDGPSQKVVDAKQLIDQKDFEKALDLLIEAQIELEERMTQRTFSLVETEIRELVKECTPYSVDPGDYEGTISNAYSMADEEKFREAMELLSRFREKLSRKVASHKVVDLLKKMTQLIKQGRSVGIPVSPFKASMTKSRVLLDAGDVEAAFQLISRQVETLDTTISNERTLVSRLDKLRGNLLAQEGKLSRLERTGVSVDEFRDKISRIKELIEDSNHQEAERELLKMDQDINGLLMAKPDQLKKEMMTTIMDGKQSRPLSIDRLTPVETKVDDRPIDPDRARNELFTLIPKIKVEITRLHSKGIDTEDFKRDIERIQNLVIKRQYIEAYQLGKDCFKKMTG